MLKALYISYDGILDPVGRSQIIPYLAGLSGKGVGISLLSFEKKDALLQGSALSAVRDLLSEKEISWKPVRYHLRPTIPATLFDILQGVIQGAGLVRRQGIGVIFARSYIAALIAYFLRIVFKTAFVFDMRGFWPEEKVDSGAWKQGGLLYRFFRRVEQKLVREADEVIVLTEAAKQLICARYQRDDARVIPCCVDLDLFSPGPGSLPDLRLPHDRLLITYVGSIGTFYDFEGAARFFQGVKVDFPEAYFLILSSARRASVIEVLDKLKVGPGDYLLDAVPHEQVPLFLQRSAFSLIFYRRSLSAAGCCPIKFAESLACGVPAIISAGVGDCDRIVGEDRVGIVVKERSLSSWQDILASMQDLLRTRQETAQRCRKTAETRFSLEEGVTRYFDVCLRASKRFKSEEG